MRELIEKLTRVENELNSIKWLLCLILLVLFFRDFTTG